MIFRKIMLKPVGNYFANPLIHLGELSKQPMAMFIVLNVLSVIVAALGVKIARSLEGRILPLSEVETLYYQASKDFDQKKYDEAIQLLQSAQQLLAKSRPNHRQSLKILLLLGKNYYRKGAWDDALARFDDVLSHPAAETDSKVTCYQWKADVFLGKADVFLEKKQEYQNAITQCMNGLTLISNRVVGNEYDDRKYDLCFSLGKAYFYLGELTQALTQLTLAAGFCNPNGVARGWVLEWMGHVLFAQKDYPAARQHLEQAKLNNPQDSDRINKFITNIPTNRL